MVHPYAPKIPKYFHRITLKQQQIQITPKPVLSSKHRYVTYSQDSSVGMVMDYGLDSQVSILDGVRCVSLPHSAKTGSEAYSASYPMSTGSSFPGVKAAGT
jgi:hypothetical protein